MLQVKEVGAVPESQQLGCNRAHDRHHHVSHGHEDN
jgi:hypothetical protein